MSFRAFAFGNAINELLLQHPKDFHSFSFLDLDGFLCVQLRKVCCWSSCVQTDAVQPSIVNQLLPERFLTLLSQVSVSKYIYLVLPNQPALDDFLQRARAARCPYRLSTYESLFNRLSQPCASDTSDLAPNVSSHRRCTVRARNVYPCSTVSCTP